MNVIEINENKGFYFIGAKAKEYKTLYLDNFENF